MYLRRAFQTPSMVQQQLSLTRASNSWAELTSFLFQNVWRTIEHAPSKNVLLITQQSRHCQVGVIILLSLTNVIYYTIDYIHVVVQLPFQNSKTVDCRGSRARWMVWGWFGTLIHMQGINGPGWHALKTNFLHCFTHEGAIYIHKIYVGGFNSRGAKEYHVWTSTQH